ncbi:MAG: PAS domain-containing hybrid sensor histidine kinase/response regulator [Thermodesulfobacteriota bacterium]
MTEKDQSKIDLDLSELALEARRIGPTPTETIDLDKLFGGDVTQSGSFDLRGVQATSLGKLLNALPTRTLLVESPRRVFFANEAWRPAEGQEAEKLEGRLLTDLFPYPAYASKIEALLDQVLAERTPQFTEAVVVVGAQKIWGRIHMRSVRLANERSILILIEDLTPEKRQLLLQKKYQKELKQARDDLQTRAVQRGDDLEKVSTRLKEEITQREAAQESLRQSDLRYRSLLEDSFDGIFVHKGGKILFANSRLYEMLGYQPGELDGVDHWMICHLDDQLTVRQRALARLRGEEVPVKFDIRLQRKDGSTFDVELHARSVRFGNDAAIQAIVRDVLHRQRSEDQMIRTERLNTIADLASGVTQSFNNLLDVVMRGAQAAITHLQKGESKQVEEILGRIAQSGIRGMSAVKALQHFARLRSDQLGESSKVFDLSEIVRQALSLCESWWQADPERKGAAVRVNHALEPGCLVLGTESELLEVAVNLIKNAAEAMPDGGEIKVKTHSDNGKAIFQLADSGTGIAPENLQKVFQPFWTTKGQRGTGMGLAMSFGIVRKHHGTVSVQSGEGKGSVFTVVLPLAEQTVETVDSEQEVPVTSGLNVLIADDPESVVQMLKGGMEQLGHHAVTALKGEEALRLLKSAPVDAIVCDEGMPDMTGLQVAEAAQEIYRSKGGKKVPFVLLSGWGEELDAPQELAESGVDTILHKPVTAEELSAAIKRILDKRSRRGESEPKS